MPLINCPECNHSVSDKALDCPSCGARLRKPKRGFFGKIFKWLFLCTRQKNHPHPIFIGLGVKKLTNCRNTVLSLLKNTK
ncbi:zinc-ribbon domain-containing protein [Acinetobacter baumannii]|uniref:zinc-ribbon domain-containing protein n=1 Tax=Acinetobacter baumannii TaxID=470 RepID=UPI003A86C53E